MPITRKFLGWDEPPLPTAVDYLFAHYQQGQHADLGNVIVVVPGRRAGRRLLEILVEQAEQRGLMLVPPKIETVGRLPEQLYQPKFPFATELVQKLAWADALRKADRQQMAALIPFPPADNEARRWMELGDLLKAQHTELAADGLDFEKVAQRGAEIDGFDEARRWQALAQVQDAYLRLLDRLELWDIQTARLVAIDRRECATTRDLVLLGTVDMNQTLRRMLEQVAERVTALIFAPPDWAARFDEHGCLIPEAWQEVPLGLSTEQVQVVEGAADQADAVVRQIASYDGRYRADEITLGVPDERLVPDLQRLLEQCSLPSRWGAGRLLAESGPYRLLDAIAGYLERGRYADFAALVRHPDLEPWIQRQGISGDWLTQLDQYYNDHLQLRLGQAWLGPAARCERLRQLLTAVEQLVEPLRSDQRQPIAHWTPPLLALLLEVYGERELDRNQPAQRITLRACEAVLNVLRDHESIPHQLAPAVTAAETLQWTLEQLATVRVPPPADETAITILGWLELPLDDAPALIVTSFNEGYVPESINSDLFLPNALRSRLKLEDNARRYARDAYALSVLLASRAELSLVVGRRTRDGDPLAPSRLLFATDPWTIAERAQRFFQPPPSDLARRPLSGEPRGNGSERRFDARSMQAACPPLSGFPIPGPQPLAEPLAQLRVTQFRDYLACKYRFYLRHVLRLRAMGVAEELDGAAFGNLLHEVLRRFGCSSSCQATDPREIRRVLNDALNQCCEEMYGRYALAPVAVQIEQLRARLESFADKQAEWARQGWRIEYTEVPGPDHKLAELNVDGEPMFLSGRIDRIDVHESTGQRVILDYKSSDSGKEPKATHQRRGEWIDLQLPLYRHLIQSLGLDGPVQLGYVLLPKDVTKTGFCLADWPEAELAAADEQARRVVRGIRRQEFWPPTDPPPSFSEEFAAICQDGVFDKWREE